MKSTAKTVGLVMVIMLFSRFMAFIMTMVYTNFFGVESTEINIYNYAITLPNTIFTILGTAITIAVIPTFAGFLGTNEKERAFKFANNITSLSVIATIILSGIGMAISPLIISLTKFKTDGYGFAVLALCIMFPVMIFYALNYIFQGLLQSLGKFAAPAAVSIPSSLIVILYVFIAGNKFGVTGLLIATFIGLAFQAIVLIPPLYKTEYRFKPSFNFRDEDVKKALKLIPPVLIGTSAYQINLFFNITVTANFKNTVTIMYFVQYTVLYSILALVYSLTAVIYPKLTMMAARGEMDGFNTHLQKALKSVVFFLIPAAAGFIGVRHQLMSFLMGWGNKITPDNISLSSDILALYAFSVLGIGIKEVMDRAFYSLKDTVRPAVNGVIIMAVNIGASLILIQVMGVLGIPLAYSISAITGAVIIMLMMKKKVKTFNINSLIITIVKILTSSAVMFAAVICINHLLGGISLGGNIIEKGIKLFVPVAVGGTVYFVCTYILKVEEAYAMLNSVKRRLVKKPAQTGDKQEDI